MDATVSRYTVTEKFTTDQSTVTWIARVGRTIAVKVEAPQAHGMYDTDVLRRALAEHAGVDAANIRPVRARNEASIAPRVWEVDRPEADTLPVAEGAPAIEVQRGMYARHTGAHGRGWTRRICEDNAASVRDMIERAHRRGDAVTVEDGGVIRVDSAGVVDPSHDGAGQPCPVWFVPVRPAAEEPPAPRMVATCCSCGAGIEMPMNGPRPACTHNGEERPNGGIVVAGYVVRPAERGTCYTDRHHVTDVPRWESGNYVPRCGECVAEHLGVSVSDLPGYEAPKPCPGCGAAPGEPCRDALLTLLADTSQEAAEEPQEQHDRAEEIRQEVTAEAEQRPCPGCGAPAGESCEPMSMCEEAREDVVRERLATEGTEVLRTRQAAAAPQGGEVPHFPARVRSVDDGQEGSVSKTDAGRRLFFVDWEDGTCSVESLDDGGQSWTDATDALPFRTVTRSTTARAFDPADERVNVCERCGEHAFLARDWNDETVPALCIACHEASGTQQANDGHQCEDWCTMATDHDGLCAPGDDSEEPRRVIHVDRPELMPNQVSRLRAGLSDDGRIDTYTRGGVDPLIWHGLAEARSPWVYITQAGRDFLAALGEEEPPAAEQHDPVADAEQRPDIDEMGTDELLTLMREESASLPAGSLFARAWAAMDQTLTNGGIECLPAPWDGYGDAQALEGADEETRANLTARFMPQDPHDSNTRPCLEIGGAQVYAHRKGGRLVVGVDVDTAEGARADGAVPMVITVQGREVFEG